MHEYEKTKKISGGAAVGRWSGRRVVSYDSLGKGNAAKAPAFSCPVAVLVVHVRNALRGLNKLWKDLWHDHYTEASPLSVIFFPKIFLFGFQEVVFVCRWAHLLLFFFFVDKLIFCFCYFFRCRVHAWLTNMCLYGTDGILINSNLQSYDTMCVRVYKE